MLRFDNPSRPSDYKFELDIPNVGDGQDEEEGLLGNQFEVQDYQQDNSWKGLFRYMCCASYF